MDNLTCCWAGRRFNPVSPLDPQHSALLLCLFCMLLSRYRASQLWWRKAGVVKFESFHWHTSNEDHKIFPFFYKSLRRDHCALLVKWYSSSSTKSVCLVYKFVDQWQGVNVPSNVPVINAWEPKASSGSPFSLALFSLTPPHTLSLPIGTSLITALSCSSKWLVNNSLTQDWARAREVWKTH